MRTLWLLVPLLLMTAFVAPVTPARAGEEPAPDRVAKPATGPEDIAELLAPIREKHDVPALGGVIVRLRSDADDKTPDAGEITALGVTGVRRLGSDEPVTATDLWHIGSCGKALTATGIARLVASGKLTWETTVADALPKLRKSMHKDYRDVTLTQLLTHRSGLPGALPTSRPKIWMAFWGARGTPQQRRASFISKLLSDHPHHAPGTQYEYANAGYVLAAHIAETVTGKPWEDLMRADVFEPLGLASVGFGPPGESVKPGTKAAKAPPPQPWGHRALGAELVPAPPGPQADNPEGFGPAGAMHLTLADWARFMAAHLQGARGKATSFLEPDGWRALHEPPEGANYAKGWSITSRPWAKTEGGTGLVLTHAGSNTMWYASVWASPERGFAVLSVCNAGGAAGAKACDAVAGALIRKHLTD